jgi:hypothetical protein
VEAALWIDTLLRECQDGARQLPGFLNGGAGHVTNLEVRSRFSNRVLYVKADAARIANDGAQARHHIIADRDPVSFHAAGGQPFGKLLKPCDSEFGWFLRQRVELLFDLAMGIGHAAYCKRELGVSQAPSEPISCAFLDLLESSTYPIQSSFNRAARPAQSASCGG